MRKSKLFVIPVMTVMLLATATGCGKEKTNGTVLNNGVSADKTAYLELRDNFTSDMPKVSELKSLESSGATSMKWDYYEDAAKKLENYQFSDFTKLTYADQYIQDRVDFISASNRLKDELPDYWRYYQVAKIDAVSYVKNAFADNQITGKEMYKKALMMNGHVSGNSKFVSLCEVYPIDYSKETNRLVYFAGYELDDGTVSERINSIEFIPLAQIVYGAKDESETEEVSIGGMITNTSGWYTTDNDLVTQKYTMESYNIDAMNNSNVMNENSIKPR